MTPPLASGSEGPTVEEPDRAGRLRALAAGLVVDRPIALVGMPGAGKTTVGRRLAALLNLPFKDADAEIEKAAGSSIADIFAERGEADFRRGERLVIARLLKKSPPFVLATGGGAYMNGETRALMRETAVTIWLRADIDVLMRRVEKKEHRPLLQTDDPRAALERLISLRHPVYAEADIIIDTGTGPHAAAVEAILRALQTRFGGAHE